MMIRATRESDGETFTFDDLPWNGSFVVTADTAIPQPASNDLSGGEFNGAHGGYATAARYQRRVFDLKFTLDGRRGVGIVGLITQGRAFFRLAADDLTAELYTLDFFTSDADHGTFRMRHGAIAAPFSAPFSSRDTKFANGSVSFIFTDPFLYPTEGSQNATGSVVDFSLYATDLVNAAPHGRKWSASGAVWASGASWAGTSRGIALSVNFVTEISAPAEISLHGACTNPAVINLTNGTEFAYHGFVNAGQVLAVDTSGTVTLAGAGAPGVWSGRLTAQPGVNEFIFSAYDTDTSAVANILLRGAF